jgi:hypothetical protein
MRRPQFSLKTVLWLMALVAVTITIGKVVVPAMAYLHFLLTLAGPPG